MWRLPNDQTQPIITAAEQIHSAHRGCHLQLPETAIVFFMSKGTDYLLEHYDAALLPEPFPRFLNRCPIWEIRDKNLCFLHGGSAAPQAVDTVETLAVLGVKNIILVGMCGGYDSSVSAGQVIVPQKAFVEEGTSLHYYEHIEEACPDAVLFPMAASLPNVRSCPIVTTDSVYRQTYAKEQLWRSKGAVGVDMETSAVFSVAKYLGLRAVALLMVSDVHPMTPDAPKWEWLITKEMRDRLTEQAMTLAKQLAE